MSSERRYLLERVDDVAVVQLYADGFASLSLREKTLAWHLYLAALAGRDIYYDQRHALGLDMRAVLEAILTHPNGVDPTVLHEVRRYTKLFWINSGPYNNLTARKFVLRLTRHELFDAATGRRAETERRCCRRPSESVERLIDRLAPMFLDASVDPTVTNKTPGPGRDILTASSNNLYSGVTATHLETFTERYGLNSRLTADNGRLVEEVYRVGGRYDREIRRIVGHLRDAMPFATPSMGEALRALIRFYETGEDADRIAYDIAWVRDQESPVDTINGFVEVYMDPRGVKGAWEGIVCYVNDEKTRDIQALAAHAQWFEDRMPWDPRFRKPDVAGVTARAIEVVVETGDSGPLTPVGINLPNDQAIREQLRQQVGLAGQRQRGVRASRRPRRCGWSSRGAAEEAERAKRWGAFAQELTTDMHEVIGHGSGRMAPGVTEPPHRLLGEQYSVDRGSPRRSRGALLSCRTPSSWSLGIVPGRASRRDRARRSTRYYARNALVQLRRVREGTQIEEDHMRNRQMIVNWLLRAHAARRSAAPRRQDLLRDGRRDGVSRGRRAAARRSAAHQGRGRLRGGARLFETYGVHFDPALRDEVVARVDRLQLPSYTGFVMPRLEARRDDAGAIVDVEISYPCDLETQMLEVLCLRAPR